MSYPVNELKIAKNRVENWPNDLEVEGQGHPLSIRVESNDIFTFGVNLVQIG